MRARVLAFLLVLSVAGLLFPLSSATAEIIVLPNPYFTNQFTTVEAWVELQTVECIAISLEDWEDYYYSIFSYTASIRDELDSISLSVEYYSTEVLAEFDFYESSPDFVPSSDYYDLKSSVTSYFNSLSTDVSYSSSNIVRNVSLVENVVNDINNNHLSNIVSSVSFGQDYGRTLPSGGCECPDYTVYLQGIYALLSQWRDSLTQQINGISNDLSRLSQEFHDFYYTPAVGVLSGAGFGNNWAGRNAFGQFLGHLLQKFSQGYIYPTNEITNPLWVALTNANPLLVQIDENQLPLPVSFGDAEFLVAVTNFEELVFMFTNQDSVETRSESEFNFAESKLQNQEQPDEEDDDLEEVSLDDLDEIGNKLQEITESYKEMFDTNLVPAEMPNSIVLHHGYRLGPITVSSMHWNPDSKTGRLLRGMRSLFRAFWFVIYLVLLYYCAAVDMLIAGALLSCCFGVLMGKPEKITTGISRVWRLFVSMLGVSPSSSE